MTSATADSRDSNVAVSIIIPMYNAATTVGQQLAALASQDSRAPFEVIVVDNGSDDNGIAVVERFRDQFCRLQVIVAVDRQGASYARNVGAAAASSPYLLFTDADDVVGAGWLEAMVDVLHAGADAVGGAIDFRRLNDKDRSAQQPLLDRLPNLLGFLPWTLSCNCGVRRDVFEKVGGFDERFERGEDVAFSWNLQLAGYQLRYVPDAILHYRLRRDLLTMFRQQLGNGELVPHLLREFREHGARPDPIRRVLMRYVGILIMVPCLPFSAAVRWKFVRRVALAVGRLRGSVKWRVVCL